MCSYVHEAFGLVVVWQHVKRREASFLAWRKTTRKRGDELTCNGIRYLLVLTLAIPHMGGIDS